MRELVSYVDEACRGGAECACAGSALLLAAADALAGRGAAGRPLPPHAQPSARHDALHALLAPAVSVAREPRGLDRDLRFKFQFNAQAAACCTDEQNCFSFLRRKSNFR